MIMRKLLLSRYTVDLEAGKFFWKSPHRLHPQLLGREAGNPVRDRHGMTYWSLTIDGKMYRRARLIFFMANGRWPTPTVDHRDHNTLNDSIRNLREASRFQQAQHRNKPRDAGVHPLGVSRNKGKQRYKAKICFNKKAYHLGYFDTPEQAHAAYVAKRQELFGEFA